MAELPTPDESQENFLDAVAACWITRCGINEGLVLDTFQDMLQAFEGRTLNSWAGFDVVTLFSEKKWSEERLWKRMHARFGAIENPWGVLAFAHDQATVAAQRRDSLAQAFPDVVQMIEEVIEKIFPAR